MSDIVERLRRNPRGVAFELEHQCADEIERLRAEARAGYDLIAVIMGDGGHHREKVGALKSADDAVARFEMIKAERDALRAEVAALQDQRREMHADTADLAMLVKRLALALRKAQPEHSTVSDAAMEFLRKRGLDGEVLR